jgi:hypothetical protein
MNGLEYTGVFPQTDGSSPSGRKAGVTNPPPKNKSMFKKLFVATLLVLASLAVVYCWQTKSHKEAVVDKTPVENPSFAFWLVQGDSQYLGVSEGEALEIEKVIATFEGLKHQKDFVGAIKMLTPPQTNDEKGWFDHLLGNDLTLIPEDEPSDRFLNKVNFHLLVGYDIEKITKDGNIVYAHIKELRVIDLSDDGANPDPVTDIQDLTFELVNSNGGYQVSRYYHANPTSLVDLKYEV